MRTETYLRTYQPQPNARHTLVCFPHAGGSASAYRTWPALLGEEIELISVQYPGREDRSSETMVDAMDVLVSEIVAELETVVGDKPYSLFGHSMGGAVAHEAAQILTRNNPSPANLFVSGRQPPHFHPEGSDVHKRSDSEVIRELLRLSPNNGEMLKQSEMAAILLPIIRNDYKLIETYAPRASELLSCLITVFAGNDDPDLPMDQAWAWEEYSHNFGGVFDFSGDHFFLVEERTSVVSTLSALLHSKKYRGARNEY